MNSHFGLNSFKISRRSFFVGAGAFGVGVAFGGLPGRVLAESAFAPNAWVTIGTDGIITIMSAPAEMGQGTMTTLPAAIAEDLDADWSKVRVVQSPADAKTYGNPAVFGLLSTLGSRAVAGYYEKLRLVGVQTRKILLINAATAWNVPIEELSTQPSRVIHAKSNRTIGYGELAKTATVPDALPAVTKADFKPLAQCRFIGKNLARVDVPAKVNGAAKYGIDIQFPNMLYGAVLFAPVQDEKPEAIDDTAAKAVAGIVNIVPFANSVGIIGSTVEATQKAKALLKVTWSQGAKARSYDSSKAIATSLVAAKDQNQSIVEMLNKGNAKTGIAGAAKVIMADFIADHIAHTQLEPLNATAKVDGDGMEIWLSTQSPTATLHACEHAMGGKDAKISIHSMMIGGAFGRTSDDADHAYYAVMLARAVPGRHVKMIWNREDEFRNDKVRPLAIQHLEAGLDAAGEIVGWRHRIVADSHFARAIPPLFERLKGKDIVTAGGADFRYQVPAQLVEYARTQSGFDIGPWRGVAAGYTKFAIESVIDEIAAAKNADPVAYRLALLKHDPRAVNVIRTVSEMADWSRKREGRALGIGYSDALGSYTAHVAEVSVNANGDILVHKFWSAIDAGVALQPLNIAGQVEGSIVMSLGAALFEQVNVKNGEIQETNFDGYRVPRMSDIPEIEVKVISTDNAPTGVGEAAIGPTAAAIANAFATLTGGKRLRHLPMLPDRVRSVLNATGAPKPKAS